MLELLSVVITAVFAGWLVYAGLGMSVYQSIIIGFCTLFVALLLKLLAVTEGILRQINTPKDH
jgi:hypothetical protein